MRETILSYNGLMVNNENDCFTVVFSEATNAIKCATGLQTGSNIIGKLEREKS